jgi:hypothetical protein
MKSVEAIIEIDQSAPPEIPPDFPFSPPETINPPMVSVPMVYVESPVQVEYRVLTRDTLEAKRLEADLNELGRDGWSLMQIIPQEKQTMLVLLRRRGGD